MPTSVNVSLPDGLSDFIRQRMADERFADPGDYVRHLIQEDRKRVAHQRLETALLDGIEKPLRSRGRGRLAGDPGRGPTAPEAMSPRP